MNLNFKEQTYDWQIIELFLGQRSIIDFESLHIKNKNDAINLIKAYGFDPENYDDQRKIHAAIIEALNFIETVLLNKKYGLEELKIPKDILFCNNIIDLLIYASFQSETLILYKIWACAILKILHAIAHIECAHKTLNIPQISEYIISRFRSHIKRDSNGNLFLGNECSHYQIPLEKIDFKYEKTRNSIILKLLHKPSNIMDTIYDHVGIRIVTKNLSDVFNVIQYLSNFYLISYPNIIAFRSKNNLIDFPRFKSTFEMLKNMAYEGKINYSDINQLLEKMIIRKSSSDINYTNPYSSLNYRAIQITCRELIRIPSQHHRILTQMANMINHINNMKTKKTMSTILKYLSQYQMLYNNEKDFMTFFPFEIQVLDSQAYSQIIEGDASHHNYKTLQLKAVRRRILSAIFQINKMHFIE